jgi:hypothetical protein
MRVATITRAAMRYCTCESGERVAGGQRDSCEPRLRHRLYADAGSLQLHSRCGDGWRTPHCLKQVQLDVLDADPRAWTQLAAVSRRSGSGAQTHCITLASPARPVQRNPRRARVVHQCTRYVQCSFDWRPPLFRCDENGCQCLQQVSFPRISATFDRERQRSSSHANVMTQLTCSDATRGHLCARC